ncbi:MAG: DUF4393 domain-containing protein [Halobacteria archaeon]|nr:DUF4393 domain-containing protein [Halobacteria archaeon]
MDRYEFPEFDEELRAEWLSDDGASLRALETRFNERVLDSAMERAGETPLDGTVENLYRLLTDDEVSSGEYTQAKYRLVRLGVDVDSLSNGRKRGSSSDDPAPTAASLRERGARLLEMSADVEHDESIHPAYPHILDQLAPDEARILRFLVTDGPQPVVNIRDVGWIPFSSDLVAAGLSMVGTEAGCRHEDRTQAYLNNLERLGLVWFSDEPVEEIDRYQLVEAQPDVKGAIDSCSRPKVVRRSIHLTPFGVDFCKVCLPVDTISEDAAGVYNVPEDRTTGEKPVRRNRDADRNRSRDATDWRRTDGTPDDIRNPHVDDHWD